MKKYLYIALIAFTSLFAQEYERNILIEVFTNSHCPICPGTHSTIDSYLANSPNASRVRFMYYHMSYPYPDDQLYQDNSQDSDGRNQVYGPFSSTPITFFDGELQSNTYNNWAGRIDNRLSVPSPIEITLTGNAEENNANINAEINMNSSLSGSLVIHFVVVEDVEYNGRNGIKNHKNVVRDMITSPTGEFISIASNQTISKSFTLTNYNNIEDLSFLVFVQNTSTLEVYQAEEATYSELSTTGVNDDESLNQAFKLEQNFPNPFNPTTKISFSIPSSQFSTLKVYDILGKEVETLIQRNLVPGNYEATFDASNLPSGIYIFTLNSGQFSQSRKMLLLK